MDANNQHDARRFAVNHPELAAAIDDATSGRDAGVLFEVRRQERRDAASATAGFVLLCVLFLLGRAWWGWGTWSLVALGATGVLLFGSLVDLAATHYARPRRLIPPAANGRGDAAGGRTGGVHR